jgi:two-component system, OmpR family, heavy metal sensor histidine kinase CusS
LVTDSWPMRIGPIRWPTELTTLATPFDAMLTRLEHSLTRLAHCAADLAHDLRTPINNRMGEAEIPRAAPAHLPKLFDRFYRVDPARCATPG